ncbi:MAG: phosphopantetheine-binding protein [Phycisphaerales bacterium]
MSLDTVDLILQIEDRFAVEFTDGELHQVRTVADLAAAVIRRSRPASSERPMVRKFFEIRDHLARLWSVPPRDIRPSTRIEAIVPGKRRQAWASLRKPYPWLPELVLKSGMDRAVLWIAAGSLFGCFALLITCIVKLGAGFGVATGLLIAVVWIVLLVAAYQRAATQLPSDLETVGDLARGLTAISMPHDGGGQRLLWQLRVVDEVRRLTAEFFGLPLDKVKPESRFVEDLGAD